MRKAVEPNEVTKIRKISPTITTVDPATVRFASFSATGASETKSKDTENSKKSDHGPEDPNPVACVGIAKTTKIPAMTKVHEWSNADTGVGPSIASGSQSQEIPITDLKIETPKIPRLKKATGLESADNPTFHDPAVATIPARTTSPMRLKPIAESEEEKVKDRANQVEIRQKLTSPTSSQPKISRNVFPDPGFPTTSQTVSRKATKVSRNFVNPLSNSK